jgi:hypothetical protein
MNAKLTKAKEVDVLGHLRRIFEMGQKKGNNVAPLKEGYISVRQASQMFNVSTDIVRRHIFVGHIEAIEHRVGNRRFYMIPVSETKNLKRLTANAPRQIIKTNRIKAICPTCKETHIIKWESWRPVPKKKFYRYCAQCDSAARATNYSAQDFALIYHG